jgi:hypothetical protein
MVGKLLDLLISTMIFGYFVVSLVESLGRLVIAWFIIWFGGRFAGSLFDLLFIWMADHSGRAV